MMKQFIKISSCILMATYLVGCKSNDANKINENNDSKSSKKTLTVGISYDLGGLGDKAFNDSAAAGIARAEKEFGIKAFHVQSKSSNDFERSVRSLVERNVDLVVCVGSMQRSVLQNIGKEFPDRKFILIDTTLDLPNVKSLVFKDEEGSFLAGYLAAKQSKKAVGFIGGMDLPVVRKFFYGYNAGAKFANSKIDVLAPKFLGDWKNIDAARATANALYAHGADVVYHVAGPAGRGVHKAAKDNQKFSIGCDADQDNYQPGYVLTSMVKRVDRAVYNSIKDLVENKFTFGTDVCGLDKDCVGLTEMKYTKKKIGDALLKDLSGISEKIKTGTIKVPATEEQLAAFLKGLPQ